MSTHAEGREDKGLPVVSVDELHKHLGELVELAHTLPPASSVQDSSPSPRYKHIKEAPDGSGLRHGQLGEIRGAVLYELRRAGFIELDQSNPFEGVKSAVPEIAPSDYVDAAMDIAARLGYLYGVRGMKGGERYE